MCEFCLKHGEGKKWYLQAKNYSDDLLSDANRRQMIEEFVKTPEAPAQALERVQRLRNLPKFVREWLVYFLTRRQKKVHYGQVVPLEDVERIFDFTSSIVRVACYCRYKTVGKEKRYCYGISMSPEGGMLEIVRGLGETFLTGPDTAGLERLTREEALAAFRSHEREGLCHTIWTFQTPFIGAICNCDRADCWAMRYTMTHDMPMLFRAEYVAEVNPDVCNGCRECMRLCQFGALAWSVSNKKASIDPRWCYGCGICRSVCKPNAIRLTERSESSIAANVW